MNKPIKSKNEAVTCKWRKPVTSHKIIKGIDRPVK
jgi:hypothetical protein